MLSSITLQSGLDLHKCNTIKELKVLVEESINIYNSKRPHLSLNMKTPNFVHEKTEVENPTRSLSNIL